MKMLGLKIILCTCSLFFSTSSLEISLNGISETPQCIVSLTESIPENISYPEGYIVHPSTYFVWDLMIDLARENITIVSFYWSMLREDVQNSSSAYQGEDIFNNLLVKSRELNLIIAQNGKQQSNNDLDKLISSGANVQWIDVERLLNAGIVHAKIWTADGLYGYLGSANMDWRSLTQVKELGVFLNCPPLVADMEKIILSFLAVAGPNSRLPVDWSEEVHTKFNRTSPMSIVINDTPSKVYFAMSPPPFTPPGRNDDLDSILNIIAKAKSFIYISVMDYAPTIVSYNKSIRNKFWPAIDDALREACVERKVAVRLLISHWRHSPPSLHGYLNSLRSLNGIDGSSLRIRYFVVPAITEEQRNLPHSRVNHNKYMVTDSTLYIGTSNWSGDYFKYTAGAAIVVEEVDARNRSSSFSTHKSLHEQLVDVFYRDWNSEFTQEL